MSQPDASSESLLVRRDQLPLPRPYLAPRTATEGRLADIWRTVLGMDCVGVEDGYQDLGGDSLHATTIFARIQEEFHVTLPLASLAKAPTVAQLAVVIDQRTAGT
jgi:acyl carrier protein